MKINEFIDDDELFEMNNFFPKTTGLDQRVWVSIKPTGSRHLPRIKYGNRGGTVISIADTPEILAGSELKSKEFKKIKKWIAINKGTLLNFWHETIDTSDLVNKLKTL